MRFEWDPGKDEINLAKHGVSFEVATRVFDDPRHLSVKDRHVSGEERWQTLGLVGGMVVLLVAHTYREDDDDEVIRIISARKATTHERQIYEHSY
ncbi:MAG: BrnT family toxin [Gammaproteobacteria bacterium]